MRSRSFIAALALALTISPLGYISAAEPQAATPDRAPAAALRCGWFVNPTPANAWLIDRDSEWTVGVQGEHQAEGDWPQFADRDWVKTNGSYGYGCACMRVVTDASTRDVLKILSAQSKPLRACAKDKTIAKLRPKE